MFKRRKSILCLLIAVLMMASASTAAMAASPYETRYNNTVMASSVASISESGLLTVDNQFQGIRGKTTKGEITTLSKGFFFRIGGTISEISSECVQFVFEDNNSQIYASMNKQKICKAEIDDGDHVNTISLNEDDPFILVFPSNAGNVTLYNTYGEVVAPRKRYVP